MNMNAVGIDVSKRKSTVAILRPGGKVVVKPFDLPHLSADLLSLKNLIRNLNRLIIQTSVLEVGMNWRSYCVTHFSTCIKFSKFFKI